jgi:hypothetical protein
MIFSRGWLKSGWFWISAGGCLVAVICILIANWTQSLIRMEFAIRSGPKPGINLDTFHTIQPGMTVDKIAVLMGAEPEDSIDFHSGRSSSIWQINYTATGGGSVRPPQVGETRKAWRGNNPAVPYPGFTIWVWFDNGGRAIDAAYDDGIIRCLSSEESGLFSPPPSFWTVICKWIGL